MVPENVKKELSAHGNKFSLYCGGHNWNSQPNNWFTKCFGQVKKKWPILWWDLVQLKMKYKLVFFWSFHGHRDGEDHYLEYKLMTSSIILWVFFSVMLQLQLICILFILFSFFCSGFTTKDVDKEILNRPANRSDSQLLHQHKHRRMNDLHIYIYSLFIWLEFNILGNGSQEKMLFCRMMFTLQMFRQLDVSF